MARYKVLQSVPNFITLSSLFCGCLGVVWTLNLDISYGVWMIWTCSVLDLLDGLVARMLSVSSDLGKQLDSLSDLVAFGLLPATIIYALSGQYISGIWPYAAFIMVVFSSLRLGLFNLDPHQSVNFKGLPVPANAILISSFPSVVNQNLSILRPELENPVYWLLIVGILSYLLVSKIPLLGFKFQNFKWSENKFRYTFLVIAAILGLSMGILGIPWIMLSYLAVSLVWQYQKN